MSNDALVPKQDIALTPESPFRRDWLKEAYKIAQGDRRIQLKREHIIAAISTLVALSTESSNLRQLMSLAYEEACKRREEMGLPVPPKPKGLEKDYKFPWTPTPKK